MCPVRLAERQGPGEDLILAQEAEVNGTPEIASV